MCGLVGIAGDISSGWRDIFTELLIIDSVRGVHSTGMGHVAREKGDLSVLKRPGQPFNLIHTKEYHDLVETPSKVLIGHNRFATFGAHTEDNAHPFMFEHIIGAHNGTLDKWSVKELFEFEKYDTDSQAIFSSINEWGVKDTMDKVTGAWALTWYDKRDNTLNFLRNDKRPLFYCYSADHCTLLWASELEMLKLVMRRHGRKVADDEWYQINPDTHFSWVVPPSINAKFPHPVQVEVKGHQYKYVPWKEKPYSYHNNVLEFGYVRPQQPPLATNKGVPDKIDTSKFRPPYKDAKGKVINKVGFAGLVHEGCAWCGNNSAIWGDFIYPINHADGGKPAYICAECYNEDEIGDIISYIAVAG